MSKKGFTLLELLAVIVVLAIIALIVTPYVTKAIKEARIKSAKESANGLVEAAETYYGTKLAKNEGEFEDITIVYEQGVASPASEIKYKGTSPVSGSVSISSDGVVTLTNIKFGTVYCNGTNKTGITFSSKVSNAVYQELILNGAYPELYQGLIPVNIATDGTVTVADTSEEWYSYTDHEWANAVLVDTSNATIKSKYFDSDMSIKTQSAGNTIPESEILQYYVWIPRYRYRLWNAEFEFTEYTPENPSETGVDPFAIEIVFENKNTIKSTVASTGLEYTHPGFTFGNEELNGFWIAKFEPSGTASNITIKPNQAVIEGLNIAEAFYAVRALENANNKYGLNASEVEPRLTKNTEWGAVAYLSHSIYGRYIDTTHCIDSGCEVWPNKNNNGTVISGCGSATMSVTENNSTTCSPAVLTYSGSTGVNASTTGNITGVYDMSGGSPEYTMLNHQFFQDEENHEFCDEYENFAEDPGIKYYDVEIFYEEPKLLGDGVREIARECDWESIYKGWDDSVIGHACDGDYDDWVTRGGVLRQDACDSEGCNDYPVASIFNQWPANGVSDWKNNSFRAVISHN